MVTAVKGLTEACWLAAVVAIPLALNPYHVEGIVWPKTLLLLILTSMLVVFAIGRELAGKLEPWGQFVRRPLVIASLTLLAAQATSTYFSTNQYLSLWGRAGRNNGLLTFAACTIMFLAISRYANQRARQRLLVAVLFGAGFVGAWALWVAPGMGDMPHGRVAGTLGNPIFLAAYLLVPVFIAASYANKSRWMWPLYLLLLGAFFVGVSRGPALGLAVGSGIMFLKGARAVAVAGILVGVLVFVARMGPGYSNSIEKRAEFWGEATDTVDAAVPYRKLIGYGPDMWIYEGAGNRGLTTYAGVAHNAPIQAFVTTGIVGLAAFLALWAAAGVVAYRSAVDWALPALSATFVESMFGITTVSVLLMFWITLGLISREETSWQTAIS